MVSGQWMVGFLGVLGRGACFLRFEVGEVVIVGSWGVGGVRGSRSRFFGTDFGEGERAAARSCGIVFGGRVRVRRRSELS